MKDDIPVVDEKKEEIMGKIGSEEIKKETEEEEDDSGIPSFFQSRK